MRNLKHSTIRHSSACCTAGRTCAEQTHPKHWSIKHSAKRRRLLWFSSGLICSPLMCFCGSSRSFLGEANPHLHSGLNPASPHPCRLWGEVCWRRRATSLIDLASSASRGDLQSWGQPGLSLRFAGCRSHAPPLPPSYSFAPEEIKQCDRIKWLGSRCMCRNCQYQPRCTRPFGETFTSSAGSRMRRKREKRKRAAASKARESSAVFWKWAESCLVRLRGEKSVKNDVWAPFRRLTLLFTRSHASHLIWRVASFRWQVVPRLTITASWHYRICSVSVAQKERKKKKNTAAFQKILCIVWKSLQAYLTFLAPGGTLVRRGLCDCAAAPVEIIYLSAARLFPRCQANANCCVPSVFTPTVPLANNLLAVCARACKRACVRFSRLVDLERMPSSLHTSRYLRTSIFCRRSPRRCESV